ncbi:MAG: SAM-dependent methyltransferase, partial [Acidimicrobiia bacterium]
MTARVPTGVDPAQLKACCAAVYEHDLVALVLGASYHPGGLALTRRLARALDLRPGGRVLDVASGPGTTAFLLAEEFGVTVDGVDAGALTVDRATTAARERGLAGRVRFLRADAEALPLAAGAYDAVVCECAFCTFSAQEAAAAEFARVLRPGGKVGLTDVTVDGDRLDPELRTLAGHVACLASARPEGATRPSSPAPACGSCVRRPTTRPSPGWSTRSTPACAPSAPSASPGWTWPPPSPTWPPPPG